MGELKSVYRTRMDLRKKSEQKLGWWLTSHHTLAARKNRRHVVM
jgi:hypothetical protein